MALANKMQKACRFLRELVWFDANEQARHDYEHVFLTCRHDLERLLPLPLSEARLLVLGCGYNYPDVALFQGVAREVFGIDVVDSYYRDGLPHKLRTTIRRRHKVLIGLLESTARHAHYRRYYSRLAQLSGTAIAHRQYDLRSYHDYRLPFDDHSFDGVISNAVLEHVTDIPRLARELQRITRPGGVTYHLWHNYYSFSGGHLPESLSLEAPWGHLRGIHETHGLNRLAPDLIVAAFTPYFHIGETYQVDANHRKLGSDPTASYEHKELLSPAIRSELEHIPLPYLLSRSWLLAGSPRA